jgi:hypothetical protein
MSIVIDASSRFAPFELTTNNELEESRNESDLETDLMAIEIDT